MNMAMITKVFTKKGQTKKANTAYALLIDCYNDQYKKQKAAGSLGGSVTSSFLARQSKEYTRTR